MVVCTPSSEAERLHAVSAEDPSGERLVRAIGHAAERLQKGRRWADEIPGILGYLGGVTGASGVFLSRRPEIAEKIRIDTGKIDAFINRLDQGWLRSEKIRRVLRRHYGLFQNNDGQH